MITREEIESVLKQAGNEEIAKEKEIHADLPILLAALAGSAFNADLTEFLDANTTEEGKAQGRSLSFKEEDEEETVPEQKAYDRPNGQKYYSRDWSGIEDVEVMRRAREMEVGTLLYGPPGTGKTALIEGAFGSEMQDIVLSGDTEVADLVGSFIPDPSGDGFLWVDGPLVVAAENGWPFYADEIGLGDPKVLSVLYSLMDGRNELVVTANPDRGTVVAKKGFFVVGATNPNAPGVNLSEALLSRFGIHAEVTTDWKLALRLGVPAKIVTIAENLAGKVEADELSWSPQFRELIQYRDLADKMGERFAIANLLAICPEQDRAEVTDVVSRAFGAAALPARI